MNQWFNESMNQWMKERTNEGMAGWMDGWMDERTDGRTDGWIVPWKFVEKLFFNKSLISGLIHLGKAWTLTFSIAFVKGFYFFSWLQDQLWKSLLQLWTLRTNLLKSTGPSPGPVPWKFVVFFFNKGLISGLSLLGQGDKPKKRKHVQICLHKHFCGRNKWSLKNSCHYSEPSKHCWGPE